MTALHHDDTDDDDRLSGPRVFVYLAAAFWGVVLGLLVCASARGDDDLDTWLKRQAAPPVCVYVFTSRSCSVCPRQQVQLDWLTKHGGWVNAQKGTGTKAHFVVVDADGFPDMVHWYGVYALPTMVAVRGDKVIERHEGLLNSDELRAMWWRAKGGR